jgi:heterodisulfide reductase subunit D
MKIEGYEFPETFYYDLGHSYACFNNETEIYQGITDLGQALLDEVLFVERPYVGRRVRQGERLLSIQPMDSRGKVIRLHAVVSGEIVAVNPVLEDSPEILEKDPYSQGWLVIIRPDDVNELNNLHHPTEERFQNWVRRELEAMRLYEMRIARCVSKVASNDMSAKETKTSKALPRIEYIPSLQVSGDGAHKVGHYVFPSSLRYDDSHAYANYDVEQGIVTQGLTDLGQGLLGEALFVELPYVGRQIRQGERLFSIQPLEPGREVRRLAATVSGEIVAVNEALTDNPSMVNGEPYEGGWVVQIRPADPSELDNLWRTDDPALDEWAWGEMERAAPPLDFLKEWLGDRASTSDLEKHLYSRDLAPVPPLLVAPLGIKTEPDIIVRPVSTAEVARIMQHAGRHQLPVTPRASASTVYFNTVPARGGILLDLNGLRSEPTLNEAMGTVTIKPAVRWQELEEWLRARGWAVRSYPTSAPSATVGGWVAMEGYGVGSLYYGCVHEHVVRLEIVLPTGEVIQVTRDTDPPLSWFTGKEGTTGIITEIEMAIRPAPEAEGHHMLLFPNREAMVEAARLLARSDPRPFNMHYADTSYHQLLKEAGFSVPGMAPGLTVDYDGDEELVRRGAAMVAKVAAQVGGRELPAEVGRHEWNTRFWALRAKRQGPSVLAAEVWLPLENLDAYIDEVERFSRGTGIKFYNYGSVVTPTHVTSFSMYRADETRTIDYVMSLSVTKRLHDIGHKYGGHPYGIGLWNTPYLQDIFSSRQLAELREHKARLDPMDILNPGKLYHTLTLLPRPLFKLGMSSLSLIRAAITRLVGEAPKPEPTPMEAENRPAYAGLMQEALTCAQCGYCRSACPVYNSLGWESAAPRGKVAATKKLAQGWNGHGVADSMGNGDAELLEEFINRVYQCTLCGTCREVCPTRIDLREMWLDLRERIADAGLAPEQFNRVRDALRDTNNILNEPNENRLIWADRLDEVPEGMVGREGADVVYFVGCVSSLFPMANSIPRAMVQIMQEAGVDFTVLGGEEWCCGFPMIGAGMTEEAVRLARHNVERVKALGVRRLVASCPSCYHVWAHTYPELLGEELPFEVIHSTEMLAEIVESGVVPMHFEGKVTYHDPCDLGRTSGVYEPPRRAIVGIPGVEFVEMAHNREDAWCCGGGGNLEMLDPDLVAKINARKIQLAADTGAETIISACQQCKRTMTAGVRAAKMRMRVMDITEFVWQAIEEAAKERVQA